MNRKPNEILMHMCCAPCSEYPLEQLRMENYEVTGYFYNPNIQPQKELDRRLENVRIFSELKSLTIFTDDLCQEEVWRAFKSSHKADHCRYCYYSRMNQVAKFAKEQGFSQFTTSLTVSPYQDHALLRLAGDAAAKHYGLTYVYKDYREGYRAGQEMAKADGLYRQKYCGCIYSLGESNYAKKIAKQLDLPMEAIPTRQTV